MCVDRDSGQYDGLDPGRHHLTNLLLHVINAVLLFLILARLTEASWRAAIVALSMRTSGEGIYVNPFPE
jgi:hypothetical protein